ncbi:hypothetical protein Hypma_003452 [Hypsizygus marmoreus]|uniref:Uncharacterized protein n=1 Tax=Hypsizygus marmoreus TaxID=39966 RepID=A0A369J262_HYPMA|nr:hypothetical protein Hypma_003452 [Hypsizygus marmoreus]
MSSNPADLNRVFLSKPTWANAFRAWLIHAEATLSPDEFNSAKNFARAFQIWYNTTNNLPDATVDAIEEDTMAMSRLCVFNFVEDFELSDDPLLDRLRPWTKTTHVAKNYRHMVNFLLQFGLIPKDDLAIAVKECDVLEDLNRCRRILWVLYQREIFFWKNVGGNTRPYQMSGEELDGAFRVTNIGKNCVIARDHEEPGSTPFKLQVPEAVAKLLKAGDIIRAGIQKVIDADYWVITSPRGIESFKAKTISLDYRPEQESLEDSEYRKLAKTLLEVPVPQDGFPSAGYTEDWFADQEHDFGSEDEITGVWDLDAELDDEED